MHARSFHASPTHIRILPALLLALLAWPSARAGDVVRTQPATGFRGIWYSNQKTNDEYVYKYSGGLATYPQQHAPIAVYVPAADKTFFVYGGAAEGPKKSLLHMVSYFDHRDKTVARPRVLLDKKTTDAHDNPTLAIDGGGRLWIFSNSHGTSRPSYIHRSVEPYSIDAFELVLTTNFSYGQPSILDDGRFLLLHTKYGHAGKSGRGLFTMDSADGATWSEPRPLAHFGVGHYQVSYCDGRRVGTAFNYHPPKGGLNARTNLYYLQSIDGGQSWQNAAGQTIATPLDHEHNPALVHDYQAEGLLVYLKDVQFDRDGRPVLLYLTSKGFQPGPENAPYTWRVARWNGRQWSTSEVTTSDHNYDYGPLYIDRDPWQIIAPTAPGPQPFGTGGQVVIWTSSDGGQSWQRGKTLTHDEQFNHTYVRRPLHHHDDFAALWASGHARQPSESALYFTDRAGSHVWRLPVDMSGEKAPPEVAW